MTNAGRRRVAFQLGAVLTALTAVLSLGLVPVPQAQAQVSSLPLQFSDVAIFATNSARLGSNAQVLAGHVVVNNASPGPTLTPGFELGVGTNVHTPAGYAIVGDSIQVLSNAVVGGNAFFNNLSNAGTIQGSQNTPLPPFPIFAPLPPFQSSTPGAVDVTVPANQTQTLAPGNYRDINVQANATLKLSPGVYNVRSIVTGLNAKLLFQNLTSGKADVRVQNQVTTGSNGIVRSDDGDPLKAAKIIFYVGFASGAGLTPNAVTFGSNGIIHANVYAPNGTVRLNDNVSATGALLGRDVDLGSNVHVDLETFFTQQAPTITSADAVTFTVGQAGTFTVTTTGSPIPSITRGGAALPSGVTFVDNGNGTGTLSGTPAAGTGGTYAITFTASNGVPPNAVQNFTLTVNQAPAITSANATTFTVGSPGSFTVTTTGFPTPSIARGGAALPAGVTFVDNGNGTGTLSGTPAAGTGGIYAITFTATNAAGSSPTQSFTLTVNQTPAITSANTVTFTVGQPGSFTVTTTGFPTPSIARGGVALPSGVNFVDNGNGTGTLSGTPAAGTGGSYAITFTATNAAGSSPTQNFTLNVNQAPVITSADNATFTVGTNGSFMVTTTGFPAPSIARGGAALPSGVTFVDNGNGTGTLSGTPAVGTGGIYAITFTATNAAGSSPTQNFTLTVNEAPTFTSANTVTFTVGQPGTFTVTTIGFPTPSIARSGALPNGVNFVDNGNGTGTLSGTPQAGSGGIYPLTFTASNGIPPNAVQNFTLNVNEAPSAVADGPYVTDANTTLSRVEADPDDLLDNDFRGFPQATITSFGGGSLGGSVTSNAAGSTATFGTGGSLVVKSNGEFTFTPETNFTGTFTFQYRLTNAGGTSDATVTIQVRPKAVGDIFGENVVGNVIVNTANGTVFSVLTNDVFNSPVTASLVSGTSTNGGTVTLNLGTGTFTYNPPVGFQGVDTFGYTITDASGFTSAPATVTVSVSGRIWFVNNNGGACPSSCNGRLTNPFTTLDAFTSVNDGVGVHPGNNDNIFVYESTTPYTFVNGTLLRTGQKLIGQDATATLAVISGVALPSGSSLPAMNTGGSATTIGSTVALAGGSTVRGLTISTGSATGLSGGAVSGVSVSEVTATTTTGTAVNLNGTGGTVSLISVSANGGTNGIFLQNTTGSFAVTGTGTAASGGTIANMAGIDGSTNGIGVYMNNAQNVSLDRLQLNNFMNFAIRGTNVNGFTLANSTINAVGAGATNGTAQGEGIGEGSIRFDNLVGTAAITNSTVTHGVYDNVGIFNTNTSTTLNLTISGSVFATTTNATAGNDALRIEIDDTVGGAPQVQANITIQSSQFTAARGDMLDVIAQKTVATAANAAIVDLDVLNNTFSNTHTGTLSGGGGLTIHGQGTLTFTVDNNDLRGARGRALNLAKGATAGVFAGTINNNRIGATGVAFSGSSEASGIYVDGAGAGSLTVAVTNNTVRRTNEAGIFVIANNETTAGNNANLNATITGNVVDEPEAFSFAGLWADIGTGMLDTSTACLDVGGVGALGNDFSNGDPSNFGDISLSVQAGSVMRLPGYSGANNDDTQITGYLTGRNANAGATSVSLSHVGTMTTNVGSCVQP